MDYFLLDFQFDYNWNLKCSICFQTVILRKMTTVNTRLLVCQLVAGKKDKLWGKLSNTLTNKEKMALWEQIRQEAIAGGATSLTGRDGAYVRDSIWGGARRDAMKKRDIADVSGKGAVNFTQVNFGIEINMEGNFNSRWIILCWKLWGVIHRLSLAWA